MRKLLLIAMLAVLAYLLFWPTPLRPVAWQPRPVPEAEGVWAPNGRLDRAVLEQSGLDGPDTVVVDGEVHARMTPADVKGIIENKQSAGGKG